MSTTFPVSLDTFPSAAALAAHTLGTDPHSTLHGNLGDAVAALQAKVGINSSAVTSSLDFKVTALIARTLTAGTGLTGGGNLSADRTFALADTAVSPGSYTLASITVDAQGRLTAASSGTAATSVSNSDGTLTISPTTGAVVASLALGHANTWTGQQTFGTSAPIFSTLTTNGGIFYGNTSGLLQQTGAGTSTTVLHGGTSPSYSALSLTADVTGTLGLARGGTNADLSATGGTSQVLRQSTSGAAITVAQLAASDLSNGTTGSGAVVLATSPTLTTPALGTPSSGNLANCTGYPASAVASGATLTAGTGLSGTTTGALLTAASLSVDQSFSPTWSGQHTWSKNSAASTPTGSLTGTWFTGGSATTTKPHLLIEPSGTTSTGWSTSGTGVGLNAASGFAGNLLDLQVAGSSKASVNASGRITGVGVWHGGTLVGIGTTTFNTTFAGNIAGGGLVLSWQSGDGNWPILSPGNHSGDFVLSNIASLNLPGVNTGGHGALLTAGSNAVLLGLRGIQSQTGVLLQLQGYSSTTPGRLQADLDTAWNAIDGAAGTDATRSSDFIIRTYTVSTAQEGLRISSAAGGVRIGVLGATPAARQTGGQNVTNNVTNDGSTDGTIPDITDGTTYATDYQNLRRALYQLARMVKQDHDALRLFGFLT